MFAERYTAPQALELGIVNWVSDAAEILVDAEKLAHKLLARAPLALGVVKCLIDQIYGQDIQTELMLEKLAQFELIRAEGTTEAVFAIMEKRDSNFKGK